MTGRTRRRFRFLDPFKNAVLQSLPCNKPGHLPFSCVSSLGFTVVDVFANLKGLGSVLLPREFEKPCSPFLAIVFRAAAF
ncbi:protein of unknown function [Candidatus Nitrospira inopinata]|uniref:Uncharacterized protein n=1 Tax=Candidatus Nitrospira inopinata TaxID=1715989 RepID=A0A0S4KU86_9BACT|nr:protein of unknown function [Candidatus Nitrospira inopinata]